MLRASCAAIVLVAGCTTPAADPVPDAARDIELGLQALRTDDGFRLLANATNWGAATYTYYDMCETAWDWWLTDDRGNRVEIANDRCAAQGTRTPLEPGESFRLVRPWDGNVLQDRASHVAPPGTYTWHVKFITLEGSSSAQVVFLVG